MYEADGIASISTPAFDGEAAINVVSEWAAKTGRVVYNVGPTIPLIPGTSDYARETLEADLKSAPPGVADRVTVFLDQALASNGESSVVYICFGTFFW